MTEQYFYQGTIRKVRIHTVVPLLLLDQYIRRQESQERVIGTLMGHLSNGVLEVKIAYDVPHDINGDEISFGKGFNTESCELHKMSSPGEDIVGWYCVSQTSIQGTKTWNLINNYYSQLTANPIFLNFDVSLQGNKLGIKTFVSEQITLLDNPCAVKLVCIPAEIDASINENMIINNLISDDSTPSGTSDLCNDISQLEYSLTKLSETLSKMDKYVSNVMNNKLKPDKRIGRMIHNALSLFPKIDPKTFSNMIDTKIKDVALVIYLSNLAKAQLEVAERINDIFTPNNTNN